MSRSNKLWQIDAIGIATCAGLAAVWYALGLHPLSQAKAQRLAMIDEAAARETKAEQAEQKQRAAQAELVKAQGNVRALSVRLQPTDQLTNRVAELTRLATSTHHLSIDEVKPGATTSTARFTTIAFTISGSGSAVDCAMFLHDLRQQLPDLGVTSMNLKGEPENTERPAHFTFDLLWYAAPASRAPGK